MELELVALATDPGSGLSPRAAARFGVHLLDPEAPLELQYKELLKRYDRVLSLHASGKLCVMGKKAEEAAQALDPVRIRVVDTGLGSAGLGAAAQRAGELLRQGASEELVLREVERLRKEGRFLLATADLTTLVKNRLLPPLGDRFGEAFGLWALFTLERGAFRRAPLPVPSARVPETIAGALHRHLGGRPTRVRALFGDVDPALRTRLRKDLEKALNLIGGTLAPMDPLAKSRVGNKAIAVFAYPI